MNSKRIEIITNDDTLKNEIVSLYPHFKVSMGTPDLLYDKNFSTDLLIITSLEGVTIDAIKTSYKMLLLVIPPENVSENLSFDNVEILCPSYKPIELKLRLQSILRTINLSEQLSQEKKILARLEEAGKMGYFIANFADGTKNKMSDAGYTMLGCEPQDHVPSGESFETFLHPDDLPKLLECRVDMQRQGFADKEFRVKRRDTGEYFWMLARTTFFNFDEEGNPTHTIGIHQDITRLKEQELQIQQMLKDDLTFAQKKLGMASLHNINKNDLLAEIKKRLEALSTLPGHEVAIKNLLRFIDKSIKIDDQWELFKQHFEHVHNGFFERLSTKIPTLTLNEKKLCAYYRSNLSTKDIANLLNIEVSSAKRGRNRLRKKLQLAEEDNLITWLEAV